MIPSLIKSNHNIENTIFLIYETSPVVGVKGEMVNS